MSVTDCPDCSAPTAPAAVPDALREHAPDGAAAIRLCTRCLRTTPAPAAAAPSLAETDLSAVLADFPTGEGGAALALALGWLGSLALAREAVLACLDHAERAGADVDLTLERLAAAGRIEAHFDIGRRRRQLRSFR